jgi:hypothetical protein
MTALVVPRSAKNVSRFPPCGNRRSIRKQWLEILDAQANGSSSPEAPLDQMTDEEMQRLDLFVQEADRERYDELTEQFPNLVVDVIRGESTADELFQQLRAAFEPIYGFLHKWDISRFLEVTRQKPIEVQQTEWAESLAVAWEVPDVLCASGPHAIPVLVKDGGRTGDDGTLPNRLRLYKFCCGVHLPVAAPCAAGATSKHDEPGS